jgi:predicted enzyme related to lactoylglutathione lyase
MDMGENVGNPDLDFKIFTVGGDKAEDAVLGRMGMSEDFPKSVPSHFQVYFGVQDCDEAVSKAQKRGGRLNFGPMDSPFGRFAALSDQQGASFTVVDMSKTEGEMPRMKDA